MILRILVLLVAATSAWMVCSSIIFYDAPLWALWLVVIAIGLSVIREAATTWLLARRRVPPLRRTTS